MKIDLNIENSLKNCPPSKNPAFKKIPDRFLKDIIHVGRIRINTKNVTYKVDDQTRELKVVQENVAPIKISFELNQFIHTEYPPVVVEDPDKPGHYFGIIGHTRDQAIKELGIEFMMYDVYKFNSPLAKRLFNNNSNKVDTPKVPHTKNDIIFQTLQAIDSEELPNTEDSIIEFIDIVASDKSKKERNSIFKGVRERKSEYANLATYHCGKGLNSTTEAAKKFNIPYKGMAGHPTTGKIGYIPPYSNPITNFDASKKLLKIHGYQPVYFTFYIPEPQPEPALTNQRCNWEDEFDEAIKDEAEWIQLVMTQLGHTVDLKQIINVLPWMKNNWLPCNLDPVAEKGGRPKEETIVDKYGRPVGNSAKIIKFGT
jgi:hypothetical protein